MKRTSSSAPTTPPLVVEYRPLASLVPYANNPRTHSERQVAEIAASIAAFGWTNPILVDEDGGIIAGHGRLLAARQLGMTEVPVIELAGLSEEQKRALVIADNKLAMNAGWNTDLLALELGELQASGFDLSLTGFSDQELAGLLSFGNAGLTDPDDIPPLPEIPISRTVISGSSGRTVSSAATARSGRMWSASSEECARTCSCRIHPSG